MKKLFDGVCSALITPFKNGKVDYAALEKIIEYQIAGGAKAISVLGTTGEPCTLSEKEKKSIIKFCGKVINRRVCFIVGSGSNCTDDAIKLSSFAAEKGADGLLVVSPYYNKCTQQGAIEYYNQIGKVGVPMIVYNVPSRTGFNILPITFAKLAENPYVYGIKQANPDINQLLELFKLAGRQVAIYSGEDALNFIFYALGGQGCISVTANAYPSTVSEIYRLASNKEFEKARMLQEKLFNINRLLFSEVNPIPIKECMHKLGFCRNEVRSPLTEMSDSRALIKEINKFEKELK